MNFLYVFLGAGLGGGLRYYISGLVQKYSVVFPLGTLAVNVLGSILLGFLLFGLDDKELLPKNMKLLLGTGLCGGFTTFSTFSVETFNLLKQSEYLLAAGNIALNLFLTVLGVFVGYLLTKSV